MPLPASLEVLLKPPWGSRGALTPFFVNRGAPSDCASLIILRLLSFINLITAFSSLSHLHLSLSLYLSLSLSLFLFLFCFIYFFGKIRY